MRRTLLGILVGLTLGAAGAWSLTLPIRLPMAITRVRPTVIVDELGNVLLGSGTPAKVEVTNFPGAGVGGALVTLLDSAPFGLTCTGQSGVQNDAISAVIPTAGARFISFIGYTGANDGPGYLTCAFGSDANFVPFGWAGSTTPVATALPRGRRADACTRDGGRPCTRRHRRGAGTPPDIRPVAAPRTRRRPRPGACLRWSCRVRLVRPRPCPDGDVVAYSPPRVARR